MNGVSGEEAMIPTQAEPSMGSAGSPLRYSTAEPRASFPPRRLAVQWLSACNALRTRMLLFAFNIALLLGALHAPTAGAAPGDMDGSFGGAYGVKFGFGLAYNAAQSVAIQNDGNILVGSSTSCFS